MSLRRQVTTPRSAPPDTALDAAASDLPGQARRAAEGDDELRVCRRYRIAPAALVRDSARGWRSGRLDRVLGGDFDVMPSA